MRLQEFRRYFKREISAWTITEDWVMFKPCELWNDKTDETITFKKLDDSFDFVIDGKTILEHIEEFKGQPLNLSGGRGAGSGTGGVFPFSGMPGGGDGADKTHPLLNAYMNTAIKERTVEGAIKAFGDKYRNADHEFGAVVDTMGFSHRHVEGNAHSVSISGGKGQIVLHNHPSGGNFSKADMVSISRGREAGIVASGKRGDYVFMKKHNFNGKAFEKAINSAKPRGKDYNDAVDKWLKANQKKFGYTYSFNKLK